MAPKLNVLFYLRNHLNKEGTRTIYIRVTQKHKKKDKSTPLRTTKSWDVSRQQVNGKDKISRKINAVLAIPLIFQRLLKKVLHFKNAFLLLITNFLLQIFSNSVF